MNPPTIFFEDSTVTGPASHALVVGVSDYANLPEEHGDGRTFGLCKLKSAALSALCFARWLVDHRAALPRPLASVRLLVAPTSDELANPKWDQYMLPDYELADPALDQFQDAASAWREAAGHDEENIAIFSYTGHGIKLTSDIMLFSDFGRRWRPVMSRGVDFSNIQNGMASSADFPMIAKTQFYFIDACRKDMSEDDQARRRYLELAKETTKVFSSLSEGGSRSVATIYSTSPGTEAMGRPGDLSFFCEALIYALDRASDPVEDPFGKVRYPVRAGVLSKLTFQRLAAQGSKQEPQHSGLNDADAVFSYLPDAPEVDVLFEWDPDDYGDTATVSLNNLREPGNYRLPPYRPVKMGYYRVLAENPPDARIEYEVVSITHNHNKLGFRFHA